MREPRRNLKGREGEVGKMSKRNLFVGSGEEWTVGPCV